MFNYPDDYDFDSAANAVTEILADLHCDLTDLNELMNDYDPDEGFSDLEYTNETAFHQYDRIMDEILTRLEVNEIIPLNFVDVDEAEASDLYEMIDDSIEIFIDQIKEADSIIATLLPQ